MNVTCPECRSVFRVDPGRIPGASVRARCAVCGGVITVSRDGTGMATPVTGTAAPAFTSRSPVAPTSGVHFGSAPTPPIAQPATRGTPAIASPMAPARPAQALPPSPPASSAPTPAAGMPGTPPRPSSMPTPAVGAPGISTYGGPRPSGAFMVGGLAPPSPPPTAVPPLPAAPPLAPPPALPPRPPAAPPSFAAPPPASPGSPPPPAPQPPRAGAVPHAPRPALGGSVSGARPINPFLANDPNAKARRLARALISDLISYFPEKKEEGLRKGNLKDLFSEEIKKSYQEFVDQIGREFAESTTHFTDALNDILANGQKVFEGNKSGVE